MIAVLQRQLKAALPHNLASKWITLGLVLVIVGLPLSRAVLTAGVIWLSLGIFLPGKQIRTVPVWIWAALALFATYVIGLFYTQDTSKGWFDLWQKIPLVTVPLALFRAEKLPARTIRALLWLMVVTCTLTIVLMFGVAVFNSIEDGLSIDMLQSCALGGNCEDPAAWLKARRWFTYSPLSGGIGQHPNWLSMILTGGFLSMVWLWDDARKRGVTFSHLRMGFVTGLTFVAIALLSSRMQQLIFAGVVLAIGLYLLTDRSTWKILIVPATLMILLFVGSMALMPESRERMTEILAPSAAQTEEVVWSGVTVRKEIWKSGWQLVGQIPLIGVGTGDYRDELTDQYYRDGFLYGHARELDPHNQILATIIAVGIPGLLVLCFWLGSQMVTAFSQKKWGWLLWIAIFLLSGLTETMLGRQIAVAYIAVIGPFLAFHLPKTGIIPGGETGSGPSAKPAHTV